VEQEHVDQNYGHTDVKLHFRRFLQHIQNFLFRNNNSELGTGIQISGAIILQVRYFQFVTPYYYRYKKLPEQYSTDNNLYCLQNQSSAVTKLRMQSY